MEQIVATVSQLNGFIKKTFEANPVFSDIWIKGEISNYKKHYSGHIYMTLKDDGGVLKAVMFKSSTHSLTFSPADGMKVMAHGRVSVYEAGGVYQLYIDEMVPDGVGELYFAYEKLKNKLAQEGLFDEKYKKPIPKYPQSIGVVTAITGAAVRDIINVLTRRYPYAKIVVYPAQVQGKGASQSICEGIEYFNKAMSCDTLIIGRGGGSIEDLWAFNEEIVAYTIAKSKIPIISAVGHEVDYTISDFVADLRAPTPSAAAEIAVPSATDVLEKLKDYDYTLKTLLKNSIELKKVKLLSLKPKSPKDFINDKYLELDSLTKDLSDAMGTLIDSKKNKFLISLGKLDALSPLKVIKRGFSIATQQNGEVIKSVKTLDKVKEFDLRLKDGTRHCFVKE